MAYQVAALLLLAIFYACYFIKLFSQRSKGIRTNQMGAGKTGEARFIELALSAVTILTPLCEVLCIALNAALLPAPLRSLGLIAAALGDAAMIAAVLEMKDSWRAGVSTTDKTELVTTGVYSISRNPAFLGFDLVYAGILLSFFSWPLLIVSVLAAVMLHLQITRVEEPFLPDAFGQAYVDYCKHVNRYLGVKR